MRYFNCWLPYLEFSSYSERRAAAEEQALLCGKCVEKHWKVRVRLSTAGVITRGITKGF
jgi:hypothetical protein